MSVYPRHFARTTPQKIAVVMARSGETLTYEELERQANQVAHAFRSRGLKPGDAVAFVLENCLDVFPFVWGAQRAGLRYVAVSSRLKVDEIAFIVQDSHAQLLLASDYLGKEVLDGLRDRLMDVSLFKTGSAQSGWAAWRDLWKSMSTAPISDESLGGEMLYSSGTTGRPKGVLRDIDHALPPNTPENFLPLIRDRFGVNDRSNYLCPAPLYHAAPLRWSMWAQWLGATVVVMEKFDAEETLRLIESLRITHGQFVPTHFIRMLKLEEAVRKKYNVSSLKLAVHAAAPCPVPIKQAMMDWWGPILVEYYAGSEGNGMTLIDSPQWLKHPGSVGLPILGEVKICDENGEPVATGTEGLVYFAGGNKFAYHNDAEKTREATNAQGWTTLGDIGRLDDDGYLYLTDRKSFMIISGGVNIYPQEIENHLILHPKVADVAVIGAPDEEFGEKVVAVVQPKAMSDAGHALADELIQFCKKSLSGVKTPRQIDFVEALPRADTGKLYKKQIRDQYWQRDH